MLVSLLESEEMLPEDLEANVEAYIKRIQLSEQAANRPARQAAASRLEAQSKQFADELWKTHNDNLRKLRDMEFEAAVAITQLVQATHAEGDLQASGEISQEERDLSDRKAKLAECMAVEKDRLSPSRPWWMGANVAASATETPVLAAAEAEREIVQRGKSARPAAEINVERLKELKRIIAKSQEVVSAVEAEILKLTKEGDAVDRRLRELAANRSFEIIKTKRVPANV